MSSCDTQKADGVDLSIIGTHGLRGVRAERLDLTYSGGLLSSHRVLLAVIYRTHIRSVPTLPRNVRFAFSRACDELSQYAQRG